MRRTKAITIGAGALALGGFFLAALGRGEAPMPEGEKAANRLAGETSPYLLQHAHNPVDWYPWGPEAFAKAKAEGRPIFLSVGYSACYWCHVMERESFEDEAIARQLNAGFVCVKVDREERPDVDGIYMTALQALTGSGGWPMSIFLTPDGRPFFGATYLPPEDRDGREGFPSLLGRVIGAWRDHRAELERDADRLTEVVRRATSGTAGDKPPVELARDLAKGGLASLAERFDPESGGFGYSPNNPRRPKFPEPSNLLFLLDQHARGAETEADRDPLAMVETSLDRMARGGIRDHLAGGYHRYSTERTWTVPHFEKMLYDNAQLASTLLLAFEATGDPRWRREAESTFAFVAETLTSPEGGFYSSLDAETDGEEGAFYVWTREEAREVLGSGEDFDIFAKVYGLDAGPNFEGGRYVLHEPRPVDEAVEGRLAPLRARLLDARNQRPKPRLDDKLLTSWNGLMIAALADGARTLDEVRYREAAEKAADFLLANLRDGDGRLLRTYRGGRAKLPAYLEDHAFLAWGLLRLYAATGDPARLDQARALADRVLESFGDPEAGGFFDTADDHESLLARPKDPSDGTVPGGNSVAIRTLIALGAETGEARYLDAAGRALSAFAPYLAESPGGAPLMLLALEEYLDARPDAVAVKGGGGGMIEPKGDGPLVPSAVVTARAEVAKAGEPVAPGDEFDVTLTLAIREGWHLYAHDADPEISRPTEIEMAPETPARLVHVAYPAGAVRSLAGAGADPIALYEGEVELSARVRLDGAAGTGPRSLAFRVRYQACNDRACLAPATLAVPFSVDVQGR